MNTMGAAVLLLVGLFAEKFLIGLIINRKELKLTATDMFMVSIGILAMLFFIVINGYVLVEYGFHPAVKDF